MKFSLYIIIFTLCITSLFGQQDVEQVVILGTGPAGLTAAVYSSRAGLSTLVIEGEEPGGQIALSYMVDNFPGFPQGVSGYELGQNMREQAQRFGTRIKSGKIVEADLSKRPFVLKTEENDVILAEALIIASGASAKWLGLESEKALIGKGVSSCAVCDGALYKNKEVVVIGGGDTALEDALFLSKYASKVTVIHRRDTLKASKYLQDKAFKNKKIHFIWNTTVEEMGDSKTGIVTGVLLRDVITGKTAFYTCHGIFVAIGHKPNTEIFQGKLELDEAGQVVTKPFSTKTSVPGVFAAGDVADPHYRQAITAAGTGCMAGIDAYHFIQQHN